MVGKLNAVTTTETNNTNSEKIHSGSSIFTKAANINTMFNFLTKKIG